MKIVKGLCFTTVVVLFLGVFTQSAGAATITVSCPTDSLQAAIDSAIPGDTLMVDGQCNEQLLITTNDLTLIGNDSSSNAEINGANLRFPTLIKIESAVRVDISGFNISSGMFGIHADAGASFSIKDSQINDMIIGINLQNNSNVKLQNVIIDKSSAIGLDATSGSTAEVIESFTISNSSAFGLEVISGAAMKVTEKSVLTLVGNLLGGQISGGASMFVDTDARIIADNNILLGLSINTGASMFVFNSHISASGNGLDGLDVVSSASLDIDGNATLTANNNRREGISLDNGSLNIFGFFSTEPNLPKIIANNNTNNGIQIEFGSKLDIGQNSSLEVTNNGLAGISLDDGSSANIHDSVIVGNHGFLMKTNSNNTQQKSRGPADIIATFGSRISFLGNNEIGLALCDRSSMARGDVRCRR